METITQKIRRCSGLLVYRVIDGSIQYLLLRASSGQRRWGPPKGGIEPGENERMAAIRETKEESGLTLADLKIDDVFYQRIMYYGDGNPLTPKTVDFWLAELTDPSAQVVLSPEHTTFKWVSLDQAVAIVPNEELASLLRSAERYLRSRADYILFN